MSNFTARFAGIATLALAALPVTAIVTAAHAAPAAHIRVADLNLASASGKAEASLRIGAAARDFCRAEKGLTLQGECQSGFRAEANEKLTTVARTQLAVAAS